MKTPVNNLEALAVDISWLIPWQYEHSFFFSRFPPRELLEAIISVQSLVNLNRLLLFRADEVLWEPLSQRFTREELNAIGFDYINCLIERIVAGLHLQLRSALRQFDDSDEDDSDYIFGRWLDETSVLLVRLDPEPPPTPQLLLPHLPPV